eukprot:CAMPEP_0170521278 /NCGR_PEP_ID=MMETSP0209-20121228/6597_1 /TAXON_ID=665100 ORGANISM="Litonotus pictus, Strain P1" /NCGR_SAMPLE_ID=MMETSP0209 /ASSEMBLY_ACC=CAM_ASM_000301 /LENGTH=127 /DNA_ID=CAMNT_0010808029 /DNA_START=121 /DNA_END=501 /DNA_ORIENTATION=-
MTPLHSFQSIHRRLGPLPKLVEINLACLDFTHRYNSDSVELNFDNFDFNQDNIGESSNNYWSSVFDSESESKRQSKEEGIHKIHRPEDPQPQRQIGVCFGSQFRKRSRNRNGKNNSQANNARNVDVD